MSVCPTSLPLNHYTTALGITNDNDINKIIEKWGLNHLAVSTPSFIELLQAQLLSPLAMFQVFCALLWLLDEYWSYTMWSLVSVIVFETTTVFQRTRTQKMLGTYISMFFFHREIFTFLTFLFCCSYLLS